MPQGKRTGQAATSETLPNAKRAKLDPQLVAASSFSDVPVYEPLPPMAFVPQHLESSEPMDVDDIVATEVQDPIVTLSGSRGIVDSAGKTISLENAGPAMILKKKSRDREDVDLAAIGVGDNRLAQEESRKTRPRRHPA